MDVKNIQFTPLELKIAKYLFKHYTEKYNGRQMARALDVNHAHVNLLCRGLVKKMLLQKEDLGNSVYFTFNYGNTLAKEFMKYVLSLEEQEFPAWLIVVLHNLKKFEKYISFGLVFGSSVKTSQFADVDVLLVYDLKWVKDVLKVKEEIRRSRIVEKPIRYVDLIEKDIYGGKNEPVMYGMLSNNLLFYGAQNYVEVIKKCHKLKSI